MGSVTDLLFWQAAIYSLDAYKAYRNRGFRLQASDFRLQDGRRGKPVLPNCAFSCSLPEV